MPKGKFCFVCGKRTEELIDGMCSDCFAEKQEIVAFPKRIEITRCSKCDMVKIENRWMRWEPKLLLKKAKVKGKVMEFKVKENKKFVIEIGGYPKGSDKVKMERHEVVVHFNVIVCPVCSRELGGYYEAIIQIRWKTPESRIRFGEVNNFVADELYKIKERDRMAFFRVEPKKEGTDFFVGSKKATKKVVQKLKEKYKADVKQSYTLVTRKDGRDVYRNIYSVRI
ncbi:MAG: NMD3-related protein [Candidatus Aenigmatarchaeota archaeon]